MTKEEEIHANIAVQTVQAAWEHMCNVAIAARADAEVLKLRVKELEDKYEPKDIEPLAAADNRA